MKKITIILISALLAGIYACENANWEFPDYAYTTTYFPYQYPVRTLVLGDYYYNNENDNNLKFKISARVGGMYENHSNWTVSFEVNDSLANNLLTNTGDTIKPLPAKYYTLTPINNLVIPKGTFHEGIDVQLTEAFLEDTMAHRVHYVIPIQITSSTTDSLLTGLPSVENPDPRIQGNWIATPKNFTLFGVKYVNPYHGKYLHRGQSVIKNTSGDIIETIVYRAMFVERDEVWALNTINKNTVNVKGILRASTGSLGNFDMMLTFDSNNNCIINQTPGTTFPVTGTGKLVKNADEWGGAKRDAIHLVYQVNDGTNVHSITDTLVFRDKDVRFEEFTPVVY